jgi:integrase/recombinase XerD
LIYIIEEKNKYGTHYIKTYSSDDNNIKLFKEKINIHSASVDIDNKTYRYLYDSNMNIISPTFNFLNIELKDSSINNILSAINALKLLYSFLELYSLDLPNLTKSDANNLLTFLEGRSMIGTLYTLDLKTQRSDSTINSYLCIYRSYISFLGYSDSILLNKSNHQITITVPESENKIKVDTYNVRRKEYKSDFTVPKYISIEDFKKLLHVVREEYTLREECIIRIMYEGGLRIGEVLGLTNEDIIEKIGITYLFIRNRYSDSPDQFAKTCMNITSKDQYKSDTYKTKSVGYQSVAISDNLLEKLNDYINIYHSNNKTKFKKNYEKFNIADSVSSKDTNFYLFINSLGKPLSANLWNKYLREIFKKAGLEVDIYHRENNLNHRLRHGFAMFMVKYKHVHILELKELLRHRSLASVLIYYRPTDEDIIDLRTQLIKSIYEVIPELSL